MSELKPYKIDVPVAMIFFNRPEQLKKVFESVKKAAPSKLFLIQDGARDNKPSDTENILKCREIVNDIDWECEVVRDYSDVNLGCGARISSGISKVFESVDRLIILEDDCVPSDSFYGFCKEMLDRYSEDERIYMVTGMNHLNEYNSVNSDYFFAKVGSIAGWATWKRFWDNVDFSMKNLENPEILRMIKLCSQSNYLFAGRYENALKKKKQLDRGEKLSSWSTQVGLASMLNSQFVIVPRVNLMTNIGLTGESANSVDSIKKVPHGLRPLYRLKLYEMEFPLKNNDFVCEEYEYEKQVMKLMKPSKPVAKFRKLESVILRTIHKDFSFLKKIKKK